MTPLRERMLVQLRRRNYSPDTIHGYAHAVEQFAGYFHKSPELLGIDEIGDFQLHLLEQKQLAIGTIALRMGALHFLYKRVLKRRDLDFENLPLLRAYVRIATLSRSRPREPRSAKLALFGLRAMRLESRSP